MPIGHTVMSSSMLWFHEDPKYVLQVQIEQDGNNAVTDLIGVGPSLCSQLKQDYNIITINDFADYIIANGFPCDMNIKEETRFVLSVRCANKFMNGKRYIL